MYKIENSYNLGLQMTTTNFKIDSSAFLIGVLSQAACYSEDEMFIWAPKENSILLDYFMEIVQAGRIVSPKTDTLKWILGRDEGIEFFEFLKTNMPPCEGRNKLIQWLKGRKVE